MLAKQVDDILTLSKALKKTSDSTDVKLDKYLALCALKKELQELEKRNEATELALVEEVKINSVKILKLRRSFN